MDVSCCVKVGPGPDPNCSPEEQEQSAFSDFSVQSLCFIHPILQHNDFGLADG